MNAHMLGVDELNQEMGQSRELMLFEKVRALRPIGPNNRISGHEDWIKQGQSVHGAADLRLGMFGCRRLICLNISICVRFPSGFPIDLGNQHLNRSPQKFIRPGIEMIDIEKASARHRVLV